MCELDPCTPQVEPALERRQLHIMTILVATAILPIKCHLILTKINTDLKESNTQGMWEAEFWKKNICLKNICFSAKKNPEKVLKIK